MIMMAKVFGCNATFMLTITRRHSPGSLKRKNQQQQNGTPITHLLSLPTVWSLKKLRALLQRTVDSNVAHRTHDTAIYGFVDNLSTGRKSNTQFTGYGAHKALGEFTA
jgi:hypothetical protein